MSDISALIRKAIECLLPLSLLWAMYGYNEKTAMCKPGSGPSPDTTSVGTFTHVFYLSHPACGIFAITAQAKAMFTYVLLRDDLPDFAF